MTFAPTVTTTTATAKTAHDDRENEEKQYTYYYTDGIPDEIGRILKLNLNI